VTGMLVARGTRTFYIPAELTPDAVHAEIRIAALDGPPLEVVRGWTEFELLIAYDWAVREHLRSEGSNPVMRRPRPTFTRR
jgi:hypothetical protein